MRDHDNELISGYFLEDIHDLHGGFRVKRTGGLVREEYIRVIDKCARDGDALHLPAGHLVWLFIDLIAKTDLFQRIDSPRLTLRRGNAGQRERQLHI